MSSDDFDRRLNEISTRWTIVMKAHQASTNAGDAARAKLAHRYGGAVFRYLMGALRDEDAAQELAHEFMLRLLRGDFHRADPDRGRFRDYIKSALINLANDHFRHRQLQPRALESVEANPAAPAVESSESPGFEDCWREELLERTWATLQQAQPNYYAVLRLRVENPEMQAREMAEQLAPQLDKQLSPATVRKTLERARAKFAELLVDEVATSLSSADMKMIEAELKELALLRYCRAAVERRK